MVFARFIRFSEFNAGFIMLLFIIPFGNIFAQHTEMEELWNNQLDTAKVKFNQPMYLHINEKEILSMLDRLPSFMMYKDNYIVSGIPTHKAINKYTADIKFQISVCQRITKTTLPFNTFLIMTYTQKSFWDIYAKSAPFKDNNYNPGLTLVKPIIYKNQLRGMASFALEHESNGREGVNSRGWNYLALSGVYFFNAGFSAQAKVWAGILDKGDPEEGGGNTDLFKYRGYGLFAMNYTNLNGKFRVSAIINPRTKFGDFNTQLEVSFKPNSKANQYLFIQWYNGYSESLLEYNQYTSMVRMGICIKPPLRNLY